MFGMIEIPAWLLICFIYLSLLELYKSIDKFMTVFFDKDKKDE